MGLEFLDKYPESKKIFYSSKPIKFFKNLNLTIFKPHAEIPVPQHPIEPINGPNHVIEIDSKCAIVRDIVKRREDRETFLQNTLNGHIYHIDPDLLGECVDVRKILSKEEKWKCKSAKSSPCMSICGS